MAHHLSRRVSCCTGSDQTVASVGPRYRAIYRSNGRVAFEATLYTAFASGKAALRAVAQSTARDMGPRGVHVAHVIVDGGINGERLRAVAPARAEQLGEAGLLNPDAIADVYWQLQQHPTTWTFELDIRPSTESF